MANFHSNCLLIARRNLSQGAKSYSPVIVESHAEAADEGLDGPCFLHFVLQRLHGHESVAL